MTNVRPETIACAFAGDVEIFLMPAYQDRCILIAEQFEDADEPVELYRREYETREEGLLAFAQAIISEYSGV